MVMRPGKVQMFVGKGEPRRGVMRQGRGQTAGGYPAVPLRSLRPIGVK
jgi:hypothetical protein